ncbi:HAD-IA family hydrolase [bacterium]|nr:HAD-IA family hydrolase [bacterium]
MLWARRDASSGLMRRKACTVFRPSGPAPAGVIFDLDGTLIDSGADIASAANAVRVRCGLSRLDAPVVAGYVGDGARMLLQRVLAHPDGDGSAPPKPDRETLDRALAMFLDIYAENVLVETRPYPGVERLLAGLADRPLMLATNKPRRLTVAILAGLGWTDVFARVVAGDDLTRRKPHPDHLVACLEGRDLATAEVAMVGDSPNDIMPARALGMIAIGVGWGLVAPELVHDARPDRYVADVDELADALGARAQP